MCEIVNIRSEEEDKPGGGMLRKVLNGGSERRTQTLQDLMRGERCDEYRAAWVTHDGTGLQIMSVHLQSGKMIE